MSEPKNKGGIPLAETAIQIIKARFSARDMFQRFWPEHYREQGNSACPFHEDSSPSFQLDKELGYCHAGCGRFDAIDLYARGMNIPNNEAISALSMEIGLDPADRHQGVAPLTLDAVFKRRGIRDATYRSILPRLELLTGNGKYPPSFAVPVTTWDGAPLGKQFFPLAGGEKKFSKGTPAKNAFIRFEGHGLIVITEGFWDALSVKDAIPDADSVAILGAGFTAKLSFLPEDKPVILFLDNDQAGRDATAKAVKALNGRCKVVDWRSSKFKDPNDVLKSIDGEHIIDAMVRNAKQPDDTTAPDIEEADILPAPPEFPSGIFHPIIERVVLALMKAFNVPRTVPVCVLLSFSGTCIGRTRGITIKIRWSEYPNLYLALVGKSGSGKSPIVDLLREILTWFERVWIEDYRRLKTQYEADCEGWKIHADAEKKAAREAAANGCSFTLSLPPRPEDPKLREIMAEDATLEGVGDMLAANPRGIMWYRDELVGLILDLDRYSGKEGSGRSRLLSAWGSGLWKGTRKDVLKRNFIPHATLSIFGGIQPRLLPRVFQAEDTEAGFTPRFLFARIQRDSPPEWTDEAVSDETVDIVRRLLERFLSWDFDGAGKPHFIGVTRGAKDLFVKWFNHQAAEPWRDPDAADDDAMLSKLRSYTLRFALILHCMDAVMSGASEMDPVTADQMGRAISLTETFTEHNRQCRRFLPTSSRERPDRTS